MKYRKYYEILEVSENAELAEIKRQYRKLAKKYHPDMNPNDKTAEERFRNLKEAYEVLKDENKRAAYDLERKRAKKAERKAERKSETKKETVAKKAPKTPKKPEPTDVSIKKTPKPAKKGRKTAEKSTFYKIIRLFLGLTLCFAVLFGVLQKCMKSEWKIAEYAEKIYASLPNLGEMSESLDGYFLKNEVMNNELDKAAEILHEKATAEVDSDIVNFKNSDGYSLLMLAKTAAMSKMLIANGAKVNYMAPDGKTALLLAVENDNAEQLQVLLEAGGDYKVIDKKSGYSALMLSKSDDVAYLLLKAGANPNYIAPDGMTALSKATAEHDHDRLTLLGQFGAQINWSDVISKQ